MAISLKNVDDRLKILENLKDQQILETKTGENGYIKFVNGMMIQWFAYRGSIHISGWCKVSFPVPFKNKPWFIQGHLLANYPSGSEYNDNISINIVSTSNTTLWCFEVGANYPTFYPVFLAIGIYYIPIVLMAVMLSWL